LGISRTKPAQKQHYPHRLGANQLPNASLRAKLRPANIVTD